MSDQADTTNSTETQADAETTALGAGETTETAAEDKTTALGADDGADARQEDAAVGAPEAYSFEGVEFAEGVEFDKEAFDALEPVLRELNMPQEAATSLVKGYAEKLVPMIEARTKQAIDDQGDELRANLARDLQADQIVGGKHLPESKAMAAKALAHALPNAAEREQFNTFMNESGLGNHPMLMRVIASFGHTLSEASNPAAAGAETSEPTAKEIFYPTGGN